MFAYIGSRTTRERNARGEGISVYKVEPESADLTPVQILKDIVNPSFLVLNQTGNRLYAVHGDTTTVSSYSVDQETGLIASLNSQDTHGSNPVHLALDPAGTHLIVSNHIGASLCILPLGADGTLHPVCQLESLSGEVGPHRFEQKQAKPHHNPISPDGRYVLVPDKGLDQIFTFQYETGRLRLVGAIATREGAGPRHLTFHPQLDFAYCINELDSTVTSYRYDSETGALTPQQRLSTLPEDFAGNSRAAEIVMAPSGRYLYASNRGHDSITVFAIHPERGWLTWVGCIKSGGRTPRFITLTPNGRFLFALNEDDDCLQKFYVSSNDGLLISKPSSYHCASPVCMVFSK